MAFFGDENEFAIEFNEIIEDEFPYRLSLYILGKDVLSYYHDGEVCVYRWDLILDLIEWLDSSLETITAEDKFPIEVEGKNATEMLSNSFQLDILDDDVMLLDKIGDWGYRHSWISARTGSFLADLTFRYIHGQIEISWNNVETYGSAIQFVYEVGCEYVDRTIFIEVVNEFVEYFRNNAKIKK